MPNPYKPDTTEYNLLENWLEFREELHTYLNDSESNGITIDITHLKEMLNFRNENHKDIITARRAKNP